MNLVIKKNDQVITAKVKLGDSLITRTVGLMFLEKMTDFEALILQPCNSIHTCFMKFPIDVLFLDKNNNVVKVIRQMKPWRFTPIYWKAIRAVEFPGGFLGKDIVEGQEVKIECIN